MRMRLVAAAVAGVLVALAVTSLSASAADPTIAAVSSNHSWNPSTATINVGQSVSWSTDGLGYHNVCVLKPGGSGDSCDNNADAEFRNGAPASSWSSYPNSHVFTAPGTYTFFCEAHKSFGMTGTITVVASSTGTSTTPPPDTMPTDTTTVPAGTDTTTTPAAGAGSPVFTGKLKRRSTRKALVLELGSSEAATLHATVFRRPPRGHSYSRISQANLKAKQGKNVATLLRKAGGLRSGSYRVKLQLVDDDGNKSATKTLTFKLA